MPVKKSITKKKVAKKTSAKKEPAKKAVIEKVTARHIPVRVRMYRQGLGDCFLITFDPAGTNEFHMLVDCGSLGASTTKVKMEDVLKNIHATTGGVLHLVIATHEHKDHVSGFNLIRKITDPAKKFKVENVWLGWTENPADELAIRIQEFKGDLGNALAVATGILYSNPLGDKTSIALAQAIHSLLGFAGDPPKLLKMGAAGSRKKLKDTGLAKTIDEAMTYVRKGLGVEARYLDPGGTPIQLPANPGFRFFILGPPRDERKLANMGADDSNELYHLSAGFRAGLGLRAESLPASATKENEMPFDLRFCFRSKDKLIAPHFVSYLDPTNKWRRIDDDWLHTAANLALQLDSMTNNTSLAFAIERVSDGKVLLFPADSQEGNWLSWHDPETLFSWGKGNDKQTKTAAELLGSTVFYKVGHHCSHNATAKGKGLELMTRGHELVAFIPVDRAVALGRNPKGSWRMPARELYRNLLQKCQGRVVRSDLGLADDAKNASHPGGKELEKELVDLADNTTWNVWKQAQGKVIKNKTVVVENLFIDYNLR